MQEAPGAGPAAAAWPGEAGGSARARARAGGLTRADRLALALLACAGAWRFRSDVYALDDAWISFRIARNWLEAGVPTFDLAQPPVEGMTNLLWTALSTLWIAALPGLDPAAPARLLGLACGVGCALVLAHVAAREAAQIGVGAHAGAHGAGGAARLAGWVTGGLAALAPSLSYHSLSGLETGLWALLFALALERFFPALRGGRRAAWGCGAWLALLAATRPEGVLAGALLSAALLAERGGRDTAWRCALPFAAGVALVVLFRWSVYGALVPNTFHAKPPAPGAGLAYAGRWLVYGAGVVGPLAALPALRASRGARGLAVAALLLLAGGVASGGDWMPGFRRLTLVSLALFLLAGIGLGVARGRARRAALAGALALAAAQGAAALALEWQPYNTRVLARLGALAAATPGIDEVAIADVGRFGWHFRGSIFDLAGLTDRHVARRPGRHGEKAWDEDYFRRRSPELLLVLGTGAEREPLGADFHVRSFEAGLLRSLVARGGYRYHDRVRYLGNHYLIFARDDVALDPALWGEGTGRDLLGELRALRR